MVIGPIIRVELNSGLENLVADAWPQLKPGDYVKVRVRELHEGQRALVDFGRFRMLAEVSFPVAVGDELVVKALETQKGQLRFGLIEASSAMEHSVSQWNESLRPFGDEALGQVRDRLERLLAARDRLPKGNASNMELSQVLVGLRAFLEPLHASFGAEHLARRLQSWCEDSGLFFEKRLEAALLKTAVPGDAGDAEQLRTQPPVMRILTQDLKPRLAMVLHLLDQPDLGQPFSADRKASAFGRSVEALLTDMVHRQSEVVRQQNASAPFQTIHFSLPLHDVPGRATLKIGIPRAHAPRSRSGFRAALLLEFDALGATRIDLVLLDRNLTATFFVKTKRAKAFVAENAQDIRSALVPFFDHVQVHVFVSEKKIADFEFEELQTAGDKILDVRV